MTLLLDRIYNEDCMYTMSRMGDETVDLTITDPPYGINFKSNRQGVDGRSGKTVQTGRDSYFQEIHGDDEVPTEWTHVLYDKHKINTAVYCFAHWRTDHIVVEALQSAEFKVKSKIIMVKSNHGMGDLRGQYAPKYEVLVYATKGRHILKKRLPDVMNVSVLYSGSRRSHPNEKPTGWITPFIENSSDCHQLVFDPFAGSGSTMVACIEMGRRFLGCEIKSQHYETASKRINQARDI